MCTTIFKYVQQYCKYVQQYCKCVQQYCKYVQQYCKYVQQYSKCVQQCCIVLELNPELLQKQLIYTTFDNWPLRSVSSALYIDIYIEISEKNILYIEGTFIHV